MFKVLKCVSNDDVIILKVGDNVDIVMFMFEFLSKKKMFNWVLL